jgi:hypothetical protein
LQQGILGGALLSRLAFCASKAADFPKNLNQGFLVSTVRCPEAFLQGRAFE